MNAVKPSDRSWFRSAAGIRYGIEIAAIVLAKIALLVLLYFAFVASTPHADTSPAALRAHLSAPAAAPVQEDPAP